MIAGTSRIHATLGALLVGAVAVAWLAAGSAGAAGLPDGRVYELVSPVDKHGSTAGSSSTGNPQEAIASAVEGPAGSTPRVLFGGVGPMGTTDTGVGVDVIATREPGGGWKSLAAVPRSEGAASLSAIPGQLLPSRDFSRILFVSLSSYVPGNPINGSASFYLGEGLGRVTWVGRPQIASPDPSLGEIENLADLQIAGASPSLSRVFLGYYGTLTPEDQSHECDNAASSQWSRECVLQSRGGANGFTSDWGFYEWNETVSGEGKLTNAGRLPDGSINPYGAVAAATTDRQGSRPDEYANEVSNDGTRAYFLSPVPDPETREACEHSGYEASHPGGCVPQLYVREADAAGARSTLVSRSLLTGLAAAHGPAEGPHPESARGGYVFASPSGARAFFASVDRLTEAAPADSSTKEYEFDATTGEVSYLRGVTPPVLAATSDGRRFVFVNTATATPELDLDAEGQVTTIARLPQPETSPGNPTGQLLVNPVRMAGAGGAVVFSTDAPVAGFNDRGGFRQIFRYDVAQATIACVSCPPAGVAPSGDAHLSSNDAFGGADDRPVDSRGIADDGSEVFFDSPDPLVPQDFNGLSDVYAWRDGSVALLSAGTGARSSFFLDNTPSGKDVFFVTADGLVPSDTDQGYDVYDARVGGVAEVSSSPPCESECQREPSAPAVFTTPTSLTFDGPANPPAPASRSMRTAKRSKARAHRRKPKSIRKRVGKRSRRSTASAKSGKGRGQAR